MISVFGIIMNVQMANGVKQHTGTTLNMMNKLINPQTASELPARLIKPLREILYSGLHWIFIVALLLVILSFCINWLDKPASPSEREA